MLALLKDRHLQGEILSWLGDRDVCVVRAAGFAEARAHRDSATIDNWRQLDLVRPLKVSRCVVKYSTAAFACHVMRELRNIADLELQRTSDIWATTSEDTAAEAPVWDALLRLSRLKRLRLYRCDPDFHVIARLEMLQDLSLRINDEVLSYSALRTLSNLRKLGLDAIRCRETRLIDLTNLSLETCELSGTGMMTVRLYGNPLRCLMHDGDYYQSVSAQELSNMQLLSITFLPLSTCRCLQTLQLVEDISGTWSGVGRFSSLRALELFQLRQFQEVSPVASHCFDRLLCLEQLTIVAIWDGSRIDTMFDFSGLVSLTSLCIHQTSPIDAYAIRNSALEHFQCHLLPLSGIPVLLANCGNLFDVQFGKITDVVGSEACAHVLSIDDKVHPDMRAIKREITERRLRLHA